MFQTESSENRSVPTGLFACGYFLAISVLGGLIVVSYVDANPTPAVSLANQILWWMVGAGLIVGAFAAWEVETESLPGPISVAKSIVLLEVCIVCGLLSARMLLGSWIVTIEGDPNPGRLYLVSYVLPSTESIVAATAYVGVSYGLLMILPMLRQQSPALKALVPVLAVSGLIMIGYHTLNAYSLKADQPVAGAIASQVHSQPVEDRAKSLEADCDAGNARACSDLIGVEWHRSREEGELKVYTRLCKRSPPMEFPPCVELATILSHKTSQEDAIDQVCAMNVDGCKAVAEAFEARYTMGYAQRAHQVVCSQQSGDDSCRRAKELEALVEMELKAPVQPTGDGAFCDSEPKSCLGLATQAMKDGRIDYARWLTFTSCKANKLVLDNCSSWLEVSRRSTYFTETLNHLLEERALKAPIDNPKAIASVVEQRCIKKDGMSCFFKAVLAEIDHPNDVEGTRKVYQRSCDLEYLRGCTNALSISTRHPGDGMPLPSDAEQRFSTLCLELNEAEACGQLATLAVEQFEWKLAHRQAADRAGMRVLLEQSCQREVAARLGDKDACRHFNRLKRGSILTG